MMTSRPRSLCSTACIATYRTRWHQKSCVAQQRLAQLTTDAGPCRLQGLQSTSCSFLPMCVSSKSALQNLTYGFGGIRKHFLWPFLWRETLGNFDFRIIRVSISLGTKFQRNRLVLIRAHAGLRKGVVASAISSMQTVW